MISKEQLEALSRAWQRVEASRPRLEGSAPLMPRKKKRPVVHPFPPASSAKN